MIIAEVSLQPQCSGGRLRVGGDAFEIASLLSDWHRRELPGIFEEEVAFTWVDDQRRRLRNLFRSAGGEMEHWQLLRRIHFSAKQLQDVTKTMNDSGEIEATVDSTGKKPKIIWRLAQ